MRWLSSKSNSAREEIATTRQCARLSAIGGFPFHEAPQQREVQSHFNTPLFQAAYQLGVTIQLLAVARLLLCQKRLDIAAAVAAGLVIHDPAGPVLVNEGAVNDTRGQTLSVEIA